MNNIPNSSQKVKYDLIVFPIIEWSHRYQRPQQIVNRFAKNGYRVFYGELLFSGESEKTKVKKISENIWQYKLPGRINHDRFREVLTGNEVERCVNGIIEMIRDFDISNAVILVQMPFWTEVAKKLKELTGWKLVFDCMDEHDGLTALNPEIVSQEKNLVNISDLVIASSKYLLKKHKDGARNLLLLPNACEFEHFSDSPKNSQIFNNLPRPIIGYYGAIMEWFDVDIIAEAASLRPHWSFVLIGNLDINVDKLRQHSNIHLLGEIAYEKLPDYLREFDIATIPFKLIPIVKATNPVKFYEYLSAGKPVISTDLPELQDFKNLYYLANTGLDFVLQADIALKENNDQLVWERKNWASLQTWEQRFQLLAQKIDELFLKASIVIVSYQNQEKIAECLESINQYTNYPNYEVIIVDNASDASVLDSIRKFINEKSNYKLISLDENLGFSAGNNVGFNYLSANSKYVILLNNDVIVTKNWLPNLIAWLEKDSTIGMVGPVTWPNGAANEASIPVGYNSISDMQRFASELQLQNIGKSFDIPMLAMYCVAFRRSLLEQVGKLDESYKVGMFEDDDYSIKVRNFGLRIVCAQNIFVHHIGRSSFGELDEKIYSEIFKKNKKNYEDKWGVKWRAPAARQIEYQQKEDALNLELSVRVGEMNDLPFISIILVNFNGKEHLSDCLNSLKKLIYPRDNIEIILFDNRSHDCSIDWIKQNHPEVVTIANSNNIGFSRACNQAAEIAKGEFLAFLNNDMRVDPGWISELLKPFNADFEIGVVGSMVLNWEGSGVEFSGRFEDLFSISYEPSSYQFVKEYAADTYSLMASGGALMMRREVFKKVGGFDPRFFMYHEDVDLGWRLWILGYKCQIATKSLVFHRGGASSKKLESKTIYGWSQKHLLWTVIKNFDDDNLRKYLPLIIYFLVQTGAWNQTSIDSLLEGYEEVLSNLSSVLHSRSIIQRSRLVNDGDIFSKTGSPIGFILKMPLYSLALRKLEQKYPVEVDNFLDPGKVAKAMSTWLTGSFQIRDELRSLFQEDAVWKASRIHAISNERKIAELHANTDVVIRDPESSAFGFVVQYTIKRIIRKIKKAFAGRGSISVGKLRKYLAVQKPKIKKQAMGQRAESGGNVLTGVEKISIVVVAYNNKDFTAACLNSIEEHSHYPNLEIIVVDNASSDGTQEYLRGWEKSGAGRILILNKVNKGFSAANNQGIVSSSGKYIVLLNNDTYVTPFWLHKLVGHYRSIKNVGLLGPVTNNIGNEAKIEIHYSDISKMLVESKKYMERNSGAYFEIPNLAFYCVMLSRELFDEVGPLDESFGLGFFEDDDYCRRVEKIGKRIICVEDVFIHHHLSASFSLVSGDRRKELFENNKKLYEAKWGAWKPHSYRNHSHG